MISKNQWSSSPKNPWCWIRLSELCEDFRYNSHVPSKKLNRVCKDISEVLETNQIFTYMIKKYPHDEKNIDWDHKLRKTYDRLLCEDHFHALRVMYTKFPETAMEWWVMKVMSFHLTSFHTPLKFMWLNLFKA